MLEERTIEPCREFVLWREAQGLFGAKYAAYLVRELEDLLGEPRIAEELYVDLRFNAELRDDFLGAADRLGDVIAEAALAAKRDALASGGDLAETAAYDGLMGRLRSVPRTAETPEERIAREWGLHPDEARPRDETWLHERRNWEREVENLRTALGGREQQVAKLQSLIGNGVPAHVLRGAQTLVMLRSESTPAGDPECGPTGEVAPASYDCGDPECGLCHPAQSDSPAAPAEPIDAAMTCEPEWTRAVDLAAGEGGTPGFFRYSTPCSMGETPEESGPAEPGSTVIPVERVETPTEPGMEWTGPYD